MNGNNGGGARPPALPPGELAAKLAHLTVVLEQHRLRGILLTQEGALRWLTGLRHQVVDIAPNAASPVSALVLADAEGPSITVVSSRIEMERLADQLPPVFAPLPEIKTGYWTSMPPIPKGVLAPEDPGYTEVVEEIVCPLVSGLEGNQARKLEWLAQTSLEVMAQTAHELEPGMNGTAARGLLLRNLAARDVEANLVLVALQGQEHHYHPLCDARYRVPERGWVKLVAGTRYAELIYSATVMIHFGGPAPEGARLAYQALQEAAVEYADCYRAGALEAELYHEVGRRFRKVEERLGLTGFADSAYLHHLGGPCSPLANRDFLIQEGGRRRLAPWRQFAVNPIEGEHKTKVELQGIVRPDGPPLMLDASGIPEELLEFSEIVSSGGTEARVARIIER